jgi:hypothetical protein
MYLVRTNTSTPLLIILIHSLVFLSCAKFGAKSTFEIQTPFAQIKGECCKIDQSSLLSLFISLLKSLKVLSSITKSGEIEEYIRPLSGFW